MRVDIAPNELQGVLLELEMERCITADGNRYKSKPNVRVVAPAKSVELDGVAAEVFAAIPSDKFITDDEILMQVESVTPSELPDIMIALELKGYVTVEAGRYKRKL